MSHVPSHPPPLFHERLGVIGAPPHWADSAGALWAYEPYVRELRLWADLFRKVEVCGWAGEGPRVGNLATYERANVVWRRVAFSTAENNAGRLKRFLQWPALLREARRTVAGSDLVLLRSPSHFGLFGALLARALRVPSITKWAGDYTPHRGEGIVTTLDRWAQNLPGKQHRLLVYGPAHPPRQISFIPALMSSAELARARHLARARTWTPPWRVLTVARLERGKGVDLAIRGLGELQRRRPELPWHFTVIGDGSEKAALRALVEAERLNERVTFTGALSFDHVQRHYATAHLLVMASTNEGWPKVIAEAWAHGAFPVAAPARLVPWILQDPQAGAVFDPHPAGLATAVGQILEQPARMQAMSPGLFRHAEGLSLENFRVRLERVLVEHYQLQCLSPNPRATLRSVGGAA